LMIQDFPSNTDNKILMALFEKGKLNFRGVWNHGKLSPRAAQRHLKDLVQQGLVLEQSRKNWKRGKKLSYSLTTKGKEKLAKNALGALNPLLERIKKLIEVYLSDPTPLRKQIVNAYKASLIKPMIEPDSSDGWNRWNALEKDTQRLKAYTTAEISEEMERLEKLFHPIHECFKTFYMLYLEILNTDPYTPLSAHDKVTTNDLKEVVLGFTKGGYPYFKSVNELKSHRIYLPTHSED